MVASSSFISWRAQSEPAALYNFRVRLAVDRLSFFLVSRWRLFFKIAKYVSKAGQKFQERIEIEGGKCIEDLEHDSTYKYLGIEENSTI